jgi:hypothetical protein
MIMKTISCAFFVGLLACVGCVSVDVQEPSVCSDKSLSFSEPSDLSTVCQNTTLVSTTGLTSIYTLPPQSTTTPIDLSKSLSDIDDVVNNLTLQVNQLSLDNTSGQLSFISSIQVDMSGMDTTTYPSMSLATYTLPATGITNELDLVVNSDTSKVLSYLTAGPVQLTITLNSNPMTVSNACDLFKSGNLTTNLNLCVAVSGSFSKKL